MKRIAERGKQKTSRPSPAHDRVREQGREVHKSTCRGTTPLAAQQKVKSEKIKVKKKILPLFLHFTSFVFVRAAAFMRDNGRSPKTITVGGGVQGSVFGEGFGNTDGDPLDRRLHRSLAPGH
ncbi:MAG: hypothetical protein KY468_20525 [Armatimonadetes bacterium]|nr:hypothetical protein [Armatimonadota bacterium]